MTPDTSGPALPPPSAFYDPEECCWKTSGVMFPSDWPTSSQTCPAWGMTRAGELYELPTPALPTAEPASSSLPTRLFDTPDTMPEAPNTGSNRTDPSKPPGLWNQIQTVLLPTPVADHSRGLPQPGTDYASLPNAVLSLLPAPTTQTGGAATRSGDRSDEMLLPAVAKAASSGALTAPPSPAGKPSSDDELPGQLSLLPEATESD